MVAKPISQPHIVLKSQLPAQMLSQISFPVPRCINKFNSLCAKSNFRNETKGHFTPSAHSKENVFIIVFFFTLVGVSVVMSKISVLRKTSIYFEVEFTPWPNTP